MYNPHEKNIDIKFANFKMYFFPPLNLRFISVYFIQKAHFVWLDKGLLEEDK